MKNKLLEKSIGVMLILTFFVSFSFAGGELPKIPMNYSLEMKVKEWQSKNPKSSETIEITIYAIDMDSKKIDLSFFIKHNIKYVPCSFAIEAHVPINLIEEMRNTVTGVDYIDLPNVAIPLEVISE